MDSAEIIDLTKQTSSSVVVDLTEDEQPLAQVCHKRDAGTNTNTTEEAPALKRSKTVVVPEEPTEVFWMIDAEDPNAFMQFDLTSQQRTFLKKVADNGGYYLWTDVKFREWKEEADLLDS